MDDRIEAKLSHQEVAEQVLQIYTKSLQDYKSLKGILSDFCVLHYFGKFIYERDKVASHLVTNFHESSYELSSLTVNDPPHFFEWQPVQKTEDTTEEDLGVDLVSSPKVIFPSLSFSTPVRSRMEPRKRTVSETSLQSPEENKLQKTMEDGEQGSSKKRTGVSSMVQNFPLSPESLQPLLPDRIRYCRIRTKDKFKQLQGKGKLASVAHIFDKSIEPEKLAAVTGNYSTSGRKKSDKIEDGTKKIFNGEKCWVFHPEKNLQLIFLESSIARLILGYATRIAAVSIFALRILTDSNRLWMTFASGTAKTSKESEEEATYKTLNPLEAAMIISVLQDALDELIIIKYVIGAPIVTSWDFRYKIPAVKLTRKLTPTRIFPEVDSKPDLTPVLKLQKDREFIELVFRKLIKHLSDDYSYAPLINAVQDLQRDTEDDEKLIRDLRKNLAYLKKLSAAVKEKKKTDDMEEEGRDELMYQLQDEMDDIALKCGVEERIVNKWENVRNAQNQWRLRNVENEYKENISKFNQKINIEKRVTNEFQMYLKANQSELEEELEEWMSWYDTEMERRENKILHLKYNRDQAEENKNRLRQLYEERTREIDKWVAFRNLRQRRIKASLIIQCWWRGMMVRKKLGPYKPKKPKKAPHKKK